MTLKDIGIVGAGIMGSAIAEVCIMSNFTVTIRSRSLGSSKTLATIEQSLFKAAARGKLDQLQVQRALERLKFADDLEAFANVDLIIESIAEDLEAKRDLFLQLDKICKPSAILATNTSTLPVLQLASSTKRMDKVCGIHFFNPANRMKLVEIVTPSTASAATIALAIEFVESLGKEPVIVKDEAGFVVNALLFAYLNNAVGLLERNVATMRDIDKAMKLGCGYPLGPFEVLDLIGLDTSMAILNSLYEEFGREDLIPTPTIKRMVAAGKLGKKSGQGFYEYH